MNICIPSVTPTSLAVRACFSSLPHHFRHINQDMNNVKAIVSNATNKKMMRSGTANSTQLIQDDYISLLYSARRSFTVL